ncbi:MAG: YceH family protein [Acidimicrobiales bacterium]
MLELTPEEVRVVGALIEKQLTTPQQHPLSLNALVAACNQTSSRNPIVSYGDRQVEAVLAGLKEKRLVRFVHPSHGRSVTRYRQVTEEVFGLEPRALALLAVLFLRGPQTVGELRGRTERLADFADLGHVEEELEALAAREEPLVTRLAREPGRKEDRYAHLLGGAVEASAAGEHEQEPAPARVAAPISGPALPPYPPAPASGSPPAQSLASQVAILQAEVAALRRDLDEVLARLRAPDS